MSTSSRFVMGGIISIIGLIGLFLASAANDGDLYHAGLLIAGFSVAFVFYLIKRGFDQAEQSAEH